MTNEDRKVLTAKPDAPAVPRGLDFHCETALTQARMVRKHCALLANVFRFRTATDPEKAANSAALAHLASVIEQLEEMAAKLKAAKEAA